MDFAVAADESGKNREHEDGSHIGYDQSSRNNPKEPWK